MDLPPLFAPLASPGVDPVAVAIAQARAGCEGGLTVHDLAKDTLRAAVVLAPEVPLARAAQVLAVFGLGLQNALGALAPPEVALLLAWDGGLWLNGARCGALTLHGPGGGVEAVPGWLVLGLRLDRRSGLDETGTAPGSTSLADEGCGDIAPDVLLAAWLRHSLVWLDTWQDEGTAPLLRDWAGLAHGIGADTVVAGRQGRALGVDDGFNLLLRQGEATVTVPLADLVKDAT